VSEAVRLAIEYPYRQSIIAFKNQVEAIASYDCTEGLSGITSKTMVVSGKEDLLYPVEAGAGLAKAIPGAVFSVINNAAHSIHIEQPQAFIDCVLDFLLKP
jgi:pimeloyl-ACP methyl ester carboxylesterase